MRHATDQCCVHYLPLVFVWTRYCVSDEKTQGESVIASLPAYETNRTAKFCLLPLQYLVDLYVYSSNALQIQRMPVRLRTGFCMQLLVAICSEHHYMCTVVSVSSCCKGMHAWVTQSFETCTDPPSIASRHIVWYYHRFVKLLQVG